MTDNDKAKAAQALGKAITMRRTEMGMKRTKLAERCVELPLLSEIENGRKSHQLRSSAVSPGARDERCRPHGTRRGL